MALKMSLEKVGVFVVGGGGNGDSGCCGGARFNISFNFIQGDKIS